MSPANTLSFVEWLRDNSQEDDDGGELLALLAGASFSDAGYAEIMRLLRKLDPPRPDLLARARSLHKRWTESSVPTVVVGLFDTTTSPGRRVGTESRRSRIRPGESLRLADGSTFVVESVTTAGAKQHRVDYIAVGHVRHT